MQPRMTGNVAIPATRGAIARMLGNPEALKMRARAHLNVCGESTHVFGVKTHGVICTVDPSDTRDAASVILCLKKPKNAAETSKMCFGDLVWTCYFPNT